MTHFLCKHSGLCHALAMSHCHNLEIISYPITRRQDTQVSGGALQAALIRRFGRQQSTIRRTASVKRQWSDLPFEAIHETYNTKYDLEQEYITPYSPDQNGLIEPFIRT